MFYYFIFINEWDFLFTFYKSEICQNFNFLSEKYDFFLLNAQILNF